MKKTPYKDRNGKGIYEGNKVSASIPSEWDSQVYRPLIGTVELLYTDETGEDQWWVDEPCGDKHELKDLVGCFLEIVEDL
ncbi:MAG: hypothetical protein V3U02_06895 [Calditrichia bacterium]